MAPEQVRCERRCPSDDVARRHWTEVAAVKAIGTTAEKEHIAGFEMPAAGPNGHRPVTQIRCRRAGNRNSIDDDVLSDAAYAIILGRTNLFQESYARWQVAALAGEFGLGNGQLDQRLFTESWSARIDHIKTYWDAYGQIPDQRWMNRTSRSPDHDDPERARSQRPGAGHFSRPEDNLRRLVSDHCLTSSRW